MAKVDRVIISPIALMLYIMVSFLISSYIISIRLQSPHIVGKINPIEPVTPERIRQYGGSPDHIETGLHINSFSEFDVVDNTFTFTGIIWFYLYPQTASLESLRDMTLERGKITRISNPAIQMRGKKMFVKYDIEGEVTSPLTYQDFPIDTHRIYFVLLHRGITPHEAILYTGYRNFIFKPQLINFGWQYFNIQGHTGIRKAQLDAYDSSRARTYPAAIFSVDITRSSVRYMTSIIMPLLFLVYLTTFTFCVAFSGAMRMSVGSITAILAYRFVIENLSPKAGYFMLSDYFFFAALVCTSVFFFMNIIDRHVYPLNARNKHTIVIMLHIVIVSLAWVTLLI